MCTKSKSACIWVLCTTLVIVVLVVYISSYFDLSLSSNKICTVDSTIMSEEDFIRNFSDQISDDISKKYVEMLRLIQPTKQAYWESLLSDLPADEEHTKEMQYILQRSAEYFDYMEESYDKEERLQLIEEAQYQEEKFRELSLTDTKDMSIYDFNIIQQKNDLKKYQQSKEAEAIRFVKDIYESWSDMNKCIPEVYQNKYQVLSDIEEMFQSTLTSNDSDKMSNIHELLSKLDSVFISDFQLSL